MQQDAQKMDVLDAITYHEKTCFSVYVSFAFNSWHVDLEIKEEIHFRYDFKLIVYLCKITIKKLLAFIKINIHSYYCLWIQI